MDGLKYHIRTNHYFGASPADVAALTQYLANFRFKYCNAIKDTVSVGEKDELFDAVQKTCSSGDASLPRSGKAPAEPCLGKVEYNLLWNCIGRVLIGP